MSWLHAACRFTTSEIYRPWKSICSFLPIKYKKKGIKSVPSVCSTFLAKPTEHWTVPKQSKVTCPLRVVRFCIHFFSKVQSIYCWPWLVPPGSNKYRVAFIDIFRPFSPCNLHYLVMQLDRFLSWADQWADINRSCNTFFAFLAKWENRPQKWTTPYKLCVFYLTWCIRGHRRQSVIKRLVWLCPVARWYKKSDCSLQVHR